ncbi:MAG: membrane protein insertion efficiency factor YidD [Proteobacteria bacterium]|nr:membrane protein insertion efficiency factor YidD [Pseudomonadota bacterium]MDA1206551.1 membrane protein insertion efficiency factor YidD [Pseudomonadota bacterium]
MTKLLILIVKTYQWTISPLLGPRCRFYPTCSDYTITSLQLHGPWKGLRLAVTRLSKCHPLHEGGIDEVPKAGERIG